MYNRTGKQEWTFQRHRQHSAQETQDEVNKTKRGKLE